MSSKLSLSALALAALLPAASARAQAVTTACFQNDSTQTLTWQVRFHYSDRDGGVRAGNWVPLPNGSRHCERLSNVLNLAFETRIRQGTNWQNSCAQSIGVPGARTVTLVIRGSNTNGSCVLQQ